MGSQNVARMLKSFCGYALEGASLLEKCVNSQKMIYYNWQERDVLMILMVVFGVSIVRNLFLVLKLPTTENTNEYVNEIVERYEWKQLVNECPSILSYKQICREMFSDNKYSLGRMYALKIFTHKVRQRYPHISHQIQSVYGEYVNKYVAAKKPQLGIDVNNSLA